MLVSVSDIRVCIRIYNFSVGLIGLACVSKCIESGALLGES